MHLVASASVEKEKRSVENEIDLGSTCFLRSQSTAERVRVRVRVSLFRALNKKPEGLIRYKRVACKRNVIYEMYLSESAAAERTLSKSRNPSVRLRASCRLIGPFFLSVSYQTKRFLGRLTCNIDIEY